MKAKNQFSLASKYWLLILAIICIILMGLSGFADTGKGPLAWVAGYTVVPMQKGINRVGMWISDVSDNFATLQEVREENKQLKEKVAELTIENNQLQQNSAELERLQELFKMHQDTADYPKVGANVIASENSNWFSRFTIDKGSNDGIEVDMNVLSGAGLVGIVTEVGPNYSIVSSIIDDKNVSAMMLETFDKCIVSGDLKLIGEGVVKFEQLANNENEVKVGTQVVTSNISDKYLQGLLIGYVSEVTVDANNLTRSGYIIPATDFHELNEVLVITTTKKDLIDKKE
ncbi:rod shape-determining protein MreC [bacterium]|uniref:rod shape-determining protein MreC n=1 Tax=Lachnospiraceae TaxID=186803 RepID=UPI002A7E7D66|nr:rod shape-determining protein MreC [bacterium]MCI7148865.1 rod shape-determining protein MreC [bacterium]MDY2885280.1 rod shape-determining protein MreC [Bariatricus sp.]MDY4194548.1 rod shape-determining protein MreC [Bariatricus sp.]MDY4503617.1 rod shape-determining protein MreC [Bariatricus sp.]